jgi:N-acetylglucosaminyl-diphospho-decaprenol L-rhamnosyltransferase
VDGAPAGIYRASAMEGDLVSASVDVVVVSYNSRDTLRGCVADVVGTEGIAVFVVDNASRDGSLEAVADLRVNGIQLDRNGGFARGCNAGWRAGDGTYVLFLNPDARIDSASVAALVEVLDREPDVGAVAPRIANGHGELEYSQRRFPRLRSTYAQALFLHRIFPRAPWVDELIRDRAAYERSGSPDWVSGAAILVRRTALEALGGWDDGFFMYAEDIDLCRRLRDAGWGIRFEPSALVVHEGGASAPRPTLLPVLAQSRIRYAAKHWGKVASTVERLGIALGELTHVVVSEGGRAQRLGHGRAFRRALGRSATRI